MNGSEEHAWGKRVQLVVMACGAIDVYVCGI